MIRTYFHGTSEANLKSILKHGLKVDMTKLWTPSNDEVYMWSPDALTEAGECESDYANEFAKQRAYESAQVAMVASKSNRCIVLEIAFDSDDVEPDFSCDNMTGAVCTVKPVSPKQINAIWISPDLGMLRGYFIYITKGLKLFARTFSKFELQVAALFEGAQFYFESDDFPLSLYK